MPNLTTITSQWQLLENWATSNLNELITALDRLEMMRRVVFIETEDYEHSGQLRELKGVYPFTFQSLFTEALAKTKNGIHELQTLARFVPIRPTIALRLLRDISSLTLTYPFESWPWCLDVEHQPLSWDEVMRYCEDLNVLSPHRKSPTGGSS